MAGLKLNDIVKKYPNGFQAVSNINLNIGNGEFISLLGPSGCGKSTTLRMIAGLEDITSGDLYIGEKRVNDIASKDRGIAMVFQSYALFPHMTVEANIAFGLKLKKVPKEVRKEKVKWAVDLLNLKGFEKNKPALLSGGQRQRVALGRALVLDPDVLLLDEPLSNLDAKLRVKMRTEIKRIHKQLKATIIYVTHDQEEAMTLSDRVVIMNKGKIMQIGTPLEIYQNPCNKFVAGFMGRPPFNFIDGKIKKDERGYKFVYQTGSVILPEYLNKKIETEIDHEKASLAVRPEDIEFSDKPTDCSFEGVTSVRETLGSEDHITVEVGDTLVTVRVAPDDSIEMDKKVNLVPKPNKLFIFSQED